MSLTKPRTIAQQHPELVQDALDEERLNILQSGPPGSLEKDEDGNPKSGADNDYYRIWGELKATGKINHLI